MADVKTETSTLTNLIQTAYDKYVEMNLRTEPMFRKFADKRPVDVTNPGATVVFQLHNDLSRVTSALTEASDVDSVALNNTNKVQVTVNEYGNAVTTTERLALESLSAIDPAVADMLAYNLRDSLDALVYAKLVGLATGRYAGTNADDETSVNGDDKTVGGTVTGANAQLVAADIRKAVARLRAASVQPREGAFYMGMLHPDTSYDLRSEAATSGANVWREPHTYTEAGVGNVWSGEVGVYEGVKFVESARVETVGGDHKVIVMGKQALVEAVSYEPKTVISPVTDKLMRFRSAGWKGLLGWNVFRPEARYVITCESSI
jgi:N4-gp56 family major capsid protein